MHPDLLLLPLTLAIAACASAVALVGLVRFAPTVPGLSLWAAAPLSLSIGVSSSLIALPAKEISGLLLGFPCALSPLFLMAGSFRYTRTAMRQYLIFGLGIAVIVAMSAFTYVWPSANLKIATVSTAAAISLCATALALVRFAHDAGKWYARALAGMLFMGAAAASICVGYSLSQPAIATAVESIHAAAGPVINLIAAISAILSTPFLVLLVATRLNGELEAERVKTQTAYERVRRLAQHVETAREDERRAIAHTLHEDIAQDLAAARWALSEPDEHGVRSVNRVLTENIKKLRTVTESLRPTSLAMLSLPDAIDGYAQSIRMQSGLAIDVLPCQKPIHLNEPTRLMFFRAAQEALTNVVRHAEASRVTISFSAETARTVMTVIDDGIGIGDEDIDKERSMGLLALRERFDAVGGEVWIAAIQPKGTILTVAVPTPEPGLAALPGLGAFEHVRTAVGGDSSMPKTPVGSG